LTAADIKRNSERKADPGEKLHTTEIIVKDAIDPIALLDGLPEGSRDRRLPQVQKRRSERLVRPLLSAVHKQSALLGSYSITFKATLYLIYRWALSQCAWRRASFISIIKVCSILRLVPLPAEQINK